MTAAALSRRIAGQGALLMTGHAMAQACALGRNAVLGYLLSKGDFGIAATLTLTLQLFEMLSDLGTERMIVQADDGDRRSLMATAHAIHIARGVLVALVLWPAAPTIALLFTVPEAEWAFRWLACVALVKAFLHLDARRLQRELRNTRLLVVEVMPQVAALALAYPAVLATGSYDAVLWLACAQAAFTVAASHAVAERVYRVAIDTEILRRFFRFGWPVLLSAVPLVMIYHGLRIVVVRAYGIDELAGYTACFTLVVMFGVLAAKVGTPLALPLLARVRSDRLEFARRTALVGEVAGIAAAGFAATFLVAGGWLVALIFGPNYVGYDLLAASLALALSIRFVQMAPSIALMALGETRPHLSAAMLRTSSLALAIVVAWLQSPLAAIALCMAAGEAIALVAVTHCLAIRRPAVWGAVLPPIGLLAAGLAIAFALDAWLAPVATLASALLRISLAGAAVMLLGIVGLPHLRGHAMSAARVMTARPGIIARPARPAAH